MSSPRPSSSESWIFCFSARWIFCQVLGTSKLSSTLSKFIHEIASIFFHIYNLLFTKSSNCRCNRCFYYRWSVFSCLVQINTHTHKEMWVTEKKNIMKTHKQILTSSILSTMSRYIWISFLFIFSLFISFL